MSEPAPRWVAKLIARTLRYAFALTLLVGGVAELTPVEGADPGWWVAVYAAFAGWLMAVWFSAWSLSGRNPLGRRPPYALPERPRRLLAARAALAWAVLTCAYMLSSLPLPPRGGVRVAAGILAAVIVAAGYAAATVARGGGVRGRALAVWLGGLGAVMLVVAALRIPRTHPGNPALLLASLAAASAWGALLVAGLLVWNVRAWGLPAREPRPPFDLADPCGES